MFSKHRVKKNKTKLTQLLLVTNIPVQMLQIGFPDIKGQSCKAPGAL